MPAREKPRRVSSLLRVTLAVVLGIAAGRLAAEYAPSSIAAVLGFDVAAFALLCAQWSVLLSASATQTKQRIDADDPGRAFAYGVSLGAAFVGFFSSLVALRNAAFEAENPLWIAVGLASVPLAWFLTHTEYALRYAHLYYRGDQDGGVDFPGDEAPALLDFAYFSFTIGMCFQVSDAVISSRPIRRTALFHALTSFVYNTVIVALTLNVTSSLLGK